MQRAHSRIAPLVALFVVNMSRTLSVATPALLNEKAAETQPPTSIGIANTGGVDSVICVTMPFALVVYENEAEMLPLLPLLNVADKPMLTRSESTVSSCANAAPIAEGRRLTVSTGSWNVSNTVNSVPPNTRVAPPTVGPIVGLFICNNDLVTDELSTAPVCEERTVSHDAAW